MNNTTNEPLTLAFTKEGSRTVTYIHDELGMDFIVDGYPANSRIECSDADSMNFIMNLLAAAGYQDDVAIF